MKKNGKKKKSKSLLVGGIMLGSALALSGCNDDTKKDAKNTTENYDPSMEEQIDIYGPAPDFEDPTEDNENYDPKTDIESQVTIYGPPSAFED